MTQFQTFADFYPYYLTQHADRNCRRLHFLGTGGVLVLATLSLVQREPWLLALLPFVGYGCAWVGHFVFERNKPAAFGHPLWSLRGDFVMFWQMLNGRIRF